MTTWWSSQYVLFTNVPDMVLPLSEYACLIACSLRHLRYRGIQRNSSNRGTAHPDEELQEFETINKTCIIREQLSPSGSMVSLKRRSSDSRVKSRRIQVGERGAATNTDKPIINAIRCTRAPQVLNIAAVGVIQLD